MTGNITLKAVWEINTYTVTFDSDGGSEVAAQTVEHGSKATEPTAPTKEGYTFKGWQLNGEAYNFATPVTGNITLKAVWEINTYTVKFVNDDGTVLSEKTYEYGTKAENIVIPDESTKTATETNIYEFAGWTPDITDVKADATYTATYTTLYRLTILDYTGGADSSEAPKGGSAEVKVDDVVYSVNKGYIGTLALTVDYEVACTVAVKNADGTFTRLESSSTGRGSYSLNMNEALTVVIVRKGDANLDGNVTSMDASMTANHAAKILAGKEGILTPLKVLAADVKDFGTIKAMDASIIAKEAATLLAGKESTLDW